MWRPGEKAGEKSAYMSPLLEIPGVDEPFNQPRQELPVVWWQTGNIDVVRSSVILEGSMTGSNLLPFVTDQNFTVDIDGECAFHVAELLMQGLDCIRPAPIPSPS
jgi:N-acylneuraminate cytidylyltransferase